MQSPKCILPCNVDELVLNENKSCVREHDRRPDRSAGRPRNELTDDPTTRRLTLLYANGHCQAMQFECSVNNARRRRRRNHSIVSYSHTYFVEIAYTYVYYCPHAILRRRQTLPSRDSVRMYNQQCNVASPTFYTHPSVMHSLRLGAERKERNTWMKTAITHPFRPCVVRTPC